jgi:hypothetical protein
VAGKRGKRVNAVQKMCTHAHKCNNDTCCNYSMNGKEGEIKGNGEFMYNIVDTL